MKISWGLTGSVWKSHWSFKQQPEIKWISILTFFQFYFKINRNQLEIVVKATYGLYPNKYFEILHLTFWGGSLVTKRFGFHSNSWGADEIKRLAILIDFRNRNMELLLLCSIIYSWCCYGNQVETSLSSCGHTYTDLGNGNEKKETLKNFLKWDKFSFYVMVDREVFTYLKNKK